jgi:hypothetical protein
VAIPSEESFGNASLEASLDVLAASIPSVESFGIAGLFGGSLQLLATPIPSEEAFGIAGLFTSAFREVPTIDIDLGVMEPVARHYVEVVRVARPPQYQEPEE